MRARWCCLLLLFAFALTDASRALADKIYVIKEADGVIRFTSTPPEAGVEAEVFTPGGTRYSVMGKVDTSLLFPNKYRKLIEEASRQYGVERSLVQGVIHAESAFNKNAISPKGAKGLMQIMPSNYDFLAITDPFAPEQSIEGGTQLLALLLTKYQGDVRRALAAYNAGEGAVDKYKGIPPYRETREYIERVLRFQKKYRRAK